MRVRVKWLQVVPILMTDCGFLTWLVHKFVQRTCAFNMFVQRTCIRSTKVKGSTNLYVCWPVNELTSSLTKSTKVKLDMFVGQSSVNESQSVNELNKFVDSLTWYFKSTKVKLVQRTYKFVDQSTKVKGSTNLQVRWSINECQQVNERWLVNFDKKN